MKVYLQANLRLNAIWYSKAIPSTVPHLITRGKPQTFVKNIIYLFMSFYHYLPLSSAQSVPSSFASFTYASLLYNKEAHCLTCQNERKSWMPVIYGRSGLLSFSQCRNPVNLLVCKIVMTLLYIFSTDKDLNTYIYKNCTISKFHQGFAVSGIILMSTYMYFT